ncbi:Rgp1-domain-containing protein [Pholiota conissans]|uniref:Rgp1-domain-containing protein n=1 Tax=Pholiota conissans TaxID=109636 RepID=A0A9P5YVP2_9AGAR|nr:Rgp1-domain-containing protein [Pholiota conissans]
MPGLTMADVESPVRVVVTPSQSSYFAGEPFSVTITFTNTRSQEAGPSKPSSLGHKRGAHSISSAPLARPPTSPGTPRSALNTTSIRTTKVVDELPRRKGFIGKPKVITTPLPQNSDPLPDLIEQRRKRQLVPKSLSVSISPFDFESVLAEGITASSAPYSQQSFQQTPTTPHIPSPLARTDALQLSSDHPHARKQSVLDGQFPLDITSPTSSVPPSPYTPNSSTSTFSLALDPIAEAAQSPYPSTPAIGSPTIEPVLFPPHTPTNSHITTNANPPAVSNNSVYAYPPPPPRHANHRPAPIGLGQPSTSRPIQPRTAFASTFPPINTELILYSYVQLTGTLVLTPVPGALPTPDQVRTLHALRAGLLSRSVLGGGSMDITATLNPPTSPKVRQMKSHSRSSSFSVGLLSMLSPSALSTLSPTPNAAPSSSGSRWRSSSSTYTPSGTPTSGRFPASANSSNVMGYGNTPAPEIDPEEPLPTFEIQPAMLAVDLNLAPGQSRSYTYTIKLPENLPPTFKGRSLKFSYELVVGTCRAGPTVGSGGNVGSNSISRVMKVPIRVYNHVTIGRSLKPYDLLWPISRRQDVGMPGTEAIVVENTNHLLEKGAHLTLSRLPSSSSSPSISSEDTLESIRNYARSLLASLPDPVSDVEVTNSKGKKVLSPLEDKSSEPVNTKNGFEKDSSDKHQNGNGTAGISNGVASSHHLRGVDELKRTESDTEKVDEGGLTGCREAVEILTRNPKKCSYDVNKEGVKVAVLTFTKSAYRLGETISGVVELNERTSRARVLKLSAILESHETLPSSISPISSARHLRRSHAEHHSSFTLNTLRTTFSLDIPSDASPAFQIRVGTPPNPPSIPDSDNPVPPAPTPGGLEWKVRLCLLVAIASESSLPGMQDVRFKSLIRDGPRGEWGSSWRATPTHAPMEKVNLRAEAEAARKRQLAQQNLASPRTWSRFIMSSILYGNLGENTEREYHDGDIMDDDGEGEGGYDGIIPDLAGGVGTGVDYAGGEEGWRGVKLETVECEVPVKVFPGNTAFKALDVVFDV